MLPGIYCSLGKMYENKIYALDIYAHILPGKLIYLLDL